MVGRVKNDIVLDEKLWNGLLTLNSTSDYLDPDDRSNPQVMDHVQDLHDTLAHDLDPNLPVSRGDGTFSPTNSETSNPDNEGVPDHAQEFRTRSGRVPKQRELYKPGQSTMCAITPTPESTSTNHDGKHRHFQYAAGGVGHRKVKCEELNSQKLHGLDWDFSSFLAGNSMDSKRILSRLLTNQEDGVWDPLALAAKSNSVDACTWNEALCSLAS